jgi:metal-sulfur cluster biosynthetic enzyme
MSAERVAEVWQTLGTVTDPEIDESVTALEFITAVDVDEKANVRVEFRLPTYWCAPNFAFLMASDMRDAVGELPWVNHISVVLLDHFSAPLINRSVTMNLDFREAFPGETDGDLAPLRKTFLGKAFERRQELLLTYLRRKGHSADGLISLRLGDLTGLSLDFEGAGVRSLYLFARRKVHPDHGAETPAFLTLEGAALDAAHFPEHLRHLRGVRITADSNGALCRGLLAARKEREVSQLAEGVVTG